MDGKKWMFRSIQGLKCRTCHCSVSAGLPAVIYKTSDGGKFWKLTHKERSAAFLEWQLPSQIKNRQANVFGDPFDGKNG